MTLHLPTRELVGLLADTHPFASKDADDTTWHRVIVKWDGSRLFALAGDGQRLAQMSWGPDDGDEPVIPGLGYDALGEEPWELAILPENAKEVATKFKVSAKEGEAPLRVTGNAASLTVERDAEAGDVALRSVILSRPWDSNAPDITAMISQLAADAASGAARKVTAYWGSGLVDFVNPKTVRQRGPVVLHPGASSTYVEIGRHFRGAIIQAEVPVER